MKRLLSLLLLVGLVQYACKKEDTVDNNSPILTSDPNGLTAVIKLYHGSTVAGNLPAPNNGSTAPQLDPSTNEQNIKALNGRFALIKPKVLSGSIAGYYVKIVGSNSYFKVDYAKPISKKLDLKQSEYITSARIPASVSHATVQINQRKLPGNQFSLPLAKMTVQSENQDSAIVLVLPQNIQPGTFCIEYMAFDELNQTSNLIKACITVSALGGGADGAGIPGSWKITASKNDTGALTPLSYQRELWEESTLYCYQDTLYWEMDSLPSYSELIIPTFYNHLKKAEFKFSQNGAFIYDNQEDLEFLDLAKSVCTHPVYELTSDSIHLEGGWSFDEQARKLIIVYDVLNNQGQEDINFVEYLVTEKTTGRFLITQFAQGNGYDITYELTRQ